MRPDATLVVVPLSMCPSSFRRDVQIDAVGRRGDAHEHPGAGSVQRVGDDRRVLERLPRAFQQEPLLRVHRPCLPRADREERRVELADVVDEASVSRVAGARVVGVRVIQSLQLPVTVGRETRHRVLAANDQLPEVFGTAHTARIAARHPHDRDRLVPAADTPVLLDVFSRQTHIVTPTAVVCAGPIGRTNLRSHDSSEGR